MQVDVAATLARKHQRRFTADRELVERVERAGAWSGTARMLASVLVRVSSPWVNDRRT